MIRTPKEISIMRDGGAMLAEMLKRACELAVPGATPLEIDEVLRRETIALKAKPAFLNFQGYPNSLCVSRGAQVVHGIPDAKPFVEGELVSFDYGVLYKDFYTDSARTVIIGKKGTPTKEKLLKVSRDALLVGLDQVRAGVHTGDIGAAIQKYVESFGFSVIRALVGHGVGRELHEDPRIPNFGIKGTGPILHAGQTVAIEPMIAAGRPDVVTAADGWTIVMADGKQASHWEDTILVTEDSYENLTRKD